MSGEGAGAAAWGRFPFGRPNTARPMRPASTSSASALVVGVYPSAFHVAWRPPADLDPRGPTVNRPLISSLAVDVEPVVFWDGITPSPAQLLESWREAVGFHDGMGTVRPGHNGPSGAGLIAQTFAPLGLEPADVAFTDVVPWFFVKGGRGSQGDAISSRFQPLAPSIGADLGSLPARPTPGDLAAIAASERRRDSLRRELVDAGAPLIITLGQEAIDSIVAVADETRGVQQRLSPDGYGRVGHATVDGRSFDLMPLVHPGFRRTVKDPRWVEALERWAASTSS